MTVVLPKQLNPYIPADWSQDGNSDVNGSIWASFNLDLSENEGKVRLGKRLLVATEDASINSTGVPCAFRDFDAGVGTPQIYTVVGSFVYAQSGTGGYPSATSFIKITASGVPVNCSSTLSDAEIFNGNLYVTANDTKIYKSTGAVWSNISFGSAGSVHMLCKYANRLYMTDLTSKVISLDSSDTPATSGTYTLQLNQSSENVITFMRAASNKIWIGTVNSIGGIGYIHEWDGAAVQVTKSYRLESAGALSCVIKDDIPYVMDTNGNLLAFNGGTFKKLDNLNRRNRKLLYNALSTTNNRYIHPNGMAIVNGKINMVIDGRNYDNTLSIEETIPSGIYEYDENRGLIHKHSFGYTDSTSSIVDYGAVRIAAAGALVEANYSSTNAARNGTFIAGANYYTNATTSISAIFYDDINDTFQKAGYLITTKIPAIDAKGNPSVQNTWQNLYLLYKKLLNASDKIVTKYRVYEADPLEVTITWVNTTSFTTTTDVTGYWTSGVGGEVEIVAGIGSGKCSHITSIVNNSGTYTVTVDETYTGASGTAKARFQNWKKIDSIGYNNSIESGVTFDQQGLNPQSNWIQFKIWMLFTGKDEIEKLIIINADTNPAN